MKSNEEIIEQIEDIVLSIARASEYSSEKIRELKFCLSEALQAKDEEYRKEKIELVNSAPRVIYPHGLNDAIDQWKEEKLKQLYNNFWGV